MTDRLDLPALGDFLRGHPPSVVINDNTAPGQRGDSHQLDATRWLERLADVLGCSPTWLLETGRVTSDDLDERGHIGRAARLIRSYGWEATPAPAQARKADRVMSDCPTFAAATASPAWRQARDRYVNHIMGCRLCCAPRGHYCPAGADLRQRYDPLPPTATRDSFVTDEKAPQSVKYKGCDAVTDKTPSLQGEDDDGEEI